MSTSSGPSSGTSSPPLAGASFRLQGQQHAYATTTNNGLPRSSFKSAPPPPAGSRFVALPSSPVSPAANRGRPTALAIQQVRQKYLGLEQEAETGFSLSRFLKEFFYHLLTPLAVPLICCLESVISCKNRLFLPKAQNDNSYVFMIQQHSLVFLWAVVNGLYFSYPEQMGWVSFTEILVTNGLVLMRCAIIALKYSFLPPSFWRRYYSELMSPTEFTGMLLLGGWKDFPPGTVVREMLLAERRLGIDLGVTGVLGREPEAYKFVDPVAQEFFEVDCGAGTMRELGCVTVTAAHYLVDFKRFYGVSPFLAAIQAILPSVVRTIEKGSPVPVRDPAAIAVICLTFCLSFFFMYANVGYAFLSVIDLARRYRWMQLLGDSIDLLAPTDEAVAAWYRLRCALMDFGKWFLHRIFAFNSLYFFYLMLLFLLLGLSVYEATRKTEVDNISVAITLFDVLLVAVSLLGVIFFGSKYNSTVSSQHVSKLKQFQLQVILDSNQQQRLHSVDVIMDLIAVESPLSFFGVPVGPVLGNALATVIGTVLVVIFQRYIQLQAS